MDKIKDLLNGKIKLGTVLKYAVLIILLVIGICNSSMIILIDELPFNIIRYISEFLLIVIITKDITKWRYEKIYRNNLKKEERIEE